MSKMKDTTRRPEPENFVIKDCGGNGDCLFKCLARAFGECGHRSMRRRIVNHVVDNWDEYRVWADYILKTKSEAAYRRLMSSPSAFGSELECKAASQLHRANITVVRKIGHRCFKQTFGLQDGQAAKRQTVYLLFTGMTHEHDDDGHFQLLQPVRQPIDPASCLNYPRIFVPSDLGETSGSSDDCADEFSGRIVPCSEKANYLARSRRDSKKRTICRRFLGEKVVKIRNFFFEERKIDNGASAYRDIADSSDDSSSKDSSADLPFFHLFLSITLFYPKINVFPFLTQKSIPTTAALVKSSI